MFFNNKFNTFFGLNLTLVYTFPMCMAWHFHFPIRNYDFNISVMMLPQVQGAVTTNWCCLQSIEAAIGGNAYQHNKVNQWTSNVVEQCLNQLTKLAKPFKYIGRSMVSVSSCALFSSFSTVSCSVTRHHMG